MNSRTILPTTKRVRRASRKRGVEVVAGRRRRERVGDAAIGFKKAMELEGWSPVPIRGVVHVDSLYNVSPRTSVRMTVQIPLYVAAITHSFQGRSISCVWLPAVTVYDNPDFSGSEYKKGISVYSRGAPFGTSGGAGRSFIGP